MQIFLLVVYSWDGVAVSVIGASFFQLIDIGATVQVHVGTGVFHKGKLLDFLISTAKVDDGACITVNGSSSWTTGSSFDSEGFAVDVDLRPRSISFPDSFL